MAARTEASVVISRARARAVLPKDIPASIPTADVAKSGNLTLLLTGANGLLGLHVLEELAQMTTCPRVIAVVRGESDSAAHARLVAAAREAGCALPTSLHVYAGDVTMREFGFIDSDAWAEAASTVDVVVHSAAAVNWAADFLDLEAANVGAVEEIIRFACVGRAKRIIAISTAAAANVFGSDPVMESEDVSDPSWMQLVERGEGPATALHYRLSKWAGERLILLASQRGLNASVFRPPILFAGQHGAANAKDTPARVLHAIITSQSVPAGAQRMTWGTVTLCARVILTNLRCGRQVIHQPHQFMNVNMMAKSLENLGYGPFAVVPHDEWVRKVETSRLGPLLSMGIYKYQWFDTQALLADSFEPSAWEAPFDQKLVYRAVRFLVRQGKLPAPSAIAPSSTMDADHYENGLSTTYLVTNIVRSKL